MKKPIVYFNCLLFIILSILILNGCRKLDLKSNPEQRIIITSPEVAEIVAAVQGVDNIVGVTYECDYPRILLEKPKVGSFGRIDMEKIVTLEPDLIFTSGLEQNRITSDLQKLGFSVVQIYPRSVDELLDSIILIGDKIGVRQSAVSLVDSLKQEIEILQEQIPENRPRVYIEIYNDPLMSVSDSSFLGELIELSGGNNIFTTLPRDYSRVNQEDIIRSDPEIIILTFCGLAENDIKTRKGWSEISAVRNSRIYTPDDIDPDLIVRASPRIIEGIVRLKEIFNEKN